MNEVPAGWRSAPLGSVCRVVSGATPKTGNPSFWGGDVVWITPEDLSRDRSKHVGRGARTLTQEGYDSCSARTFPAGSVIYSSRAPIGYVAIASNEMCTNQGCKTAIPPADILSEYLYWYLIWKTPDIEARASGTTFKEISGKGFGETELIWPSLDEQHRIIDILEDHLARLEAASAYLRRAEARASAFNRSSVESAIRSTPSRRLRLHEVVARLEAGKSFGAGGRPAAADEWGIIKVSAMTWGAFRPEENKAVHDPARVNAAYEIHAGDVLVSRANTTEYVGASVYVETTRPRLLLSDKSLRIVPRDGVDPRWLQTVLSAPSTRAQISERATGTKDSMRNISQPALLSVEIHVPATADQAQVVKVAAGAADSVARLLNAVQRTTSRAAALRRALLDAAFSGLLTGAAPDMDRVEELAGV